MRDRFMWWSPRRLTNPWVPRVFRGSDEHHNRSVAVIVPLLGCFTFFWEAGFTREGREHLSGWDGKEWSGDFWPGCPVCWEIRTDFHDLCNKVETWEAMIDKDPAPTEG